MANELSGEERLIARYFRPLAKHPAALELLDDAAAPVPPAGCDLVLKTDGLIRGVHFFDDDPADPVARRPPIGFSSRACPPTGGRSGMA